MIVEGNFGEFGNKLMIDWSYEPREMVDQGVSLNPKDKGVRDTQCDIHSLGSYGRVTGIARQNPKDRFEKDKGRKVSLEKALKAAKFDKEQRQLIWAAYHARKNKVAEVKFTIPTSKLSSVIAGITGFLNEK